MMVRTFTERIYDYCLKFSGTVTLWVTTVGRDPHHGTAHRGHHLLGLAVDIEYDGSRPGQLADDYLSELALVRSKVGAADHVEPSSWPP